MPTYKVTVAEKTYTVEVPNPNARPVRAIVDGEEVLVELAPAGADAPATGAAASVVATPSAPTPSLAPAVPTGAKGDIKAPLPGTVISIGVAVGDKVTRGQELCVLEAMKMNNPIRATQAGTVTAVYVRIGEQIQHGARLMHIGD